MKRVNIADAKTHLSKYIREVRRGETLVICDRNVPVVELRPIGLAQEDVPKFGTLRDKVWISEGAFSPLVEDELEEWDRPLLETEG